jgi:two-component system alkaline phosphatase synthesis response regulator PhoP
LIYCVEDDNSIRELILYTLKAIGIPAEGFTGGDLLLKALGKTPPELVLLDIMLPGEDGISILRRLKADPKTRDIPVIIITAKNSEYDKITGLDGGADDYVTKPFGMMELVSRIKAVLRRTKQKSAQSEIKIGRITLDIGKHSVLVEGSEVKFTPKEFEMLRYMMENEGLVISRDKILEEIWGYDFGGETRTVDVHVRSLRKKLGVHGDEIETVRGVGYRIGGVR